MGFQDSGMKDSCPELPSEAAFPARREPRGFSVARLKLAFVETLPGVPTSFGYSKSLVLEK